MGKLVSQSNTVRVSLKSLSDPRGLAFPLGAGWALYPRPLPSTPAGSRSQLRLYSADEKTEALRSQPGNTSPSCGTARIQTQAWALKDAMAQPTLWPQLPGSKVWSMQDFTWQPRHSPGGYGSPGWRRPEQGPWEGAGTLEPAPEPDRTDVSAESEEAGSWDRWQVGRPGACYPDRFPLYRLADQSHDGHTRAFRSISAAFELRLLLQIDPRSHVDNTPERFTDPKVLLHSVHAHSPAGYT